MPALDSLPLVANFWSFALGAVLAFCSMMTWIRVAHHRAHAGVLHARAVVLDAQTRQLVARCEQERRTKTNDARLAAEKLDRQLVERLGEAHLLAVGELVEGWRREPELLFDLLPATDGGPKATPPAGKRRRTEAPLYS